MADGGEFYGKSGTVRCCCGKIVFEDAKEGDLIINDYEHETLGADGAFCGPVIKHQLRDLQRERDRAVCVLGDLAALVRGKCPALLNEDSGGDAELDMEIDAVLLPNKEV